MGLGIVIKKDGQGLDGNFPEPSRVEVQERLGETTRYSIQFSEDVCSNDFQLLRAALLDPNTVLSVCVPVKDKMQCLVKGPVSIQNVQLMHGGEGSTLAVRGTDTSVTFDREFMSVIRDDITDSGAVEDILKNTKYTKDIEKTNGTYLEKKHSLVQRSTDLQFIRRLARKNGFYFWITCDDKGIETAHFRRLKLKEDALLDLIINEADNNVDSLEIQWDTERPTSVEGAQQDLSNKGRLDGNVDQSPQRSLGSSNLKNITKDKRSISVTGPGDDAADIKARGEAALMEAEWFIHANCTTSFHRLCNIVRAHTIVNVRGAGSRHSGKYLVAGVKHIIGPADHVMEVELLRNGWDA